MKFFRIICFIIVLIVPSRNVNNSIHFEHVYQQAMELDFILMSKDLPLEFLYKNARHTLKKERVIVSAYNNVVSQTDSTPNICAWNDPVRPGIIAVTRDLERAGLKRNVKVIVEDVGKFTVLDRMNKRYEKGIDIFMGKDIDLAKEFGIKELNIYWKG